MKHLIAAIALSAASNIAAADGFAPWNDRAANFDDPVTSAPATTGTSGFAPWIDHTDVMDIHDSDPLIGVVEPGHFRPWS